MPKTNRVAITREIDGKPEEFIFNTTSESEGTAKLDELLSNSVVDLSKLREELSTYLFKASTAPKKGNAKVENAPPSNDNTAPSATTTDSTRGRGDSNDLRKQMIEFFQEGLKAGTSKTEIIKAAQTKFGKTYANTYYYYERVMNGGDAKKAKKKAA